MVLKLHCKIHGLSRPLLQDETASSINRVSKELQRALTSINFSPQPLVRCDRMYFTPRCDKPDSGQPQ
jgi:hypothetical protein